MMSKRVGARIRMGGETFRTKLRETGMNLESFTRWFYQTFQPAVRGLSQDFVVTKRTQAAQIAQLEQDVTRVGDRLGDFQSMSFLQRLAWLLFGLVPKPLSAPVRATPPPLPVEPGPGVEDEEELEENTEPEYAMKPEDDPAGPGPQGS